MAEFIVDTNVAMIANRQDVSVIPSCVTACIKFLIEVKDSHVVLLDQGDEIRSEYATALQMRRPYELGAQFLVHILRNQFVEAHVRRIALATEDNGDFSDFPDAAIPDFDRSDRKFAALSRVTGIPVTNAVDSDWAIHHEALEANGIAVNFLCGGDRTSWFVARP